MFWFRSLVLGLLGACCLLLATRPAPTQGPPIVVLTTPAPSCAPPPAREPVTVVDVAPGVTAEHIARLVVLAPGEHIVAVDDAPASSLATLATEELGSRRYVDVSIASDGGASRRVLVLLR